MEADRGAGKQNAARGRRFGVNVRQLTKLCVSRSFERIFFNYLRSVFFLFLVIFAELDD